jgi:hypothetical protein
MLFLRWLLLALLLGAAVSFLLFAVTGQERYKRYGLITLKWTLIAGFGFFVVLIVERLV